jgi:histidyl-tRNA synthetase
MNGENLSLRPEGTAPTVRAALEHNLLYPGPQRLWYSGPLFRHERPQKGRYRQYHSFGAEALGFAGPDIDIELLVMARRLWEQLGLEGIELQINTIGSAAERSEFRGKLIAYFDQHHDVLDEDAKRRLHTNPLRILDSKNPAMQALVEAAPKLMDFLGPETLAHFGAVRAVLDAVGLAHTVNTRLVRGMDYYNLTVFEWVTDKLGSQGTVCGGGRYDGLFEMLGGKPTPAVGWGLGIERLLLLLEAVGIAPPSDAPDVYAIVSSDAARVPAMAAADALRAAGVSVVVHAQGRDGIAGFKAQFKKADASGARHALVFGDDELARGVVKVQDLRDRDAGALERPLADVGAWASALRNA